LCSAAQPRHKLMPETSPSGCAPARSRGQRLCCGDECAARDNLKSEATKCGVGADRIVFATISARPCRPSGAVRVADFSGTLPHNAHPTTTDALWAWRARPELRSDRPFGRVAGACLKPRAFRNWLPLRLPNTRSGAPISPRSPSRRSRQARSPRTVRPVPCSTRPGHPAYRKALMDNAGTPAARIAARSFAVSGE